MIDELSIIIPALNEEKYLPKLLNSILQQDFKGKMEVIVVDGNSTDQTIKVAEDFKQKIPNLSILTLHKRGIGYQRNKGAAKAKYKYLLFLDSDIILRQHFLNKFMKKTKVREIFVETTNMWIAEKNDILSQFAFTCMYPTLLFLFLRDKVTPGFLLLTTKKNHIKIHGFREDLKTAEDVDYGWRSIKNGANYHMQLDLFVLLSARRPKKIGRLRFVYNYIRGYSAMRKYGVEESERMDYPFGIFG